MARRKSADVGYIEQPLPPSRDERRQRVYMAITFTLAGVALVVGIVLRYTVFASRFEPTPFRPVASPSASPSPSPVTP